MSNPVRHFVDGGMVTTVVLNVAGVITGVAAAIAGLLTVAWGAIRLYETETVQTRLPERYRLARFKSAK
jgi:hypothetical protein